MEQTIKKLNWLYYGQMVITLIALTAMYYASYKNMFEPLDRMSRLGMLVQYFVIFDALITIPFGLYIVRMFKPQTDEKYFKCAASRILLTGNSMLWGIIAFYWMAGYHSMLWVAAISAIALYFSKPTVGKMEQEMNQSANNEETY